MLNSIQKQELESNVQILLDDNTDELTIKEYVKRYVSKNDPSPVPISTADILPTAPADVTLNTPETDVVDPMLPRMSKLTDDQGFLSALNAYKSDMLSLPGRALASVPAAFSGKSGSSNSMGSVVEGMKDTKGETLTGSIVRSPATAAAMLAAIPTFGTSLSGIIPAASSIALESAVGATEQQLENLNEKKPIRPGSLATDFSLGLLGGTFGEVGGKVITAAGKRVSSKLANRYISNSADKLIEKVKPTGKDVVKGFKKKVLVDNEIFGSADEALKKTQDIIDENITTIGEIVDFGKQSSRGIKSTRKNPVKAEPKVDVLKVIDNMSTPDKMTKGYLKEQKSALDDLVNRISEIDPNGQVKISDIPTVKRIIAESRRTAGNEADEILSKTYKALDDEFIDVVNKNISGKVGDQVTNKADVIIAANKKLSELIPVENTLLNKIKLSDAGKPKGFISETLDMLISPKNAVMEFTGTKLGAPGVASALQTGYKGVKQAMPFVGKKALKNVKAMELVKKFTEYSAQNPGVDPTKSLMRGLVRHFTDADYEIAMNFIKGRKLAKEALKGNKFQTFGTVGALGLPRDE